MSDNQIPPYPQPMPGAPVTPPQAAQTQGAPIPPPPTYQMPPQQQYQQAPPTGKKRTTGLGSIKKEKWPAVLLAFTLGWIGIHKFYLGYKSEGMVMLLVGAIGTLCVGLGLLVMEIIAIIEAVKYVTLTEEEFQETYVKGYKGWF